MALGQQQRFTEAIDTFQRALETDRVPILLAMLGHTHAIAGDREKAEEVLTTLEYESKSRYISPYDLAVIHAGLGDHEAALRELTRAYDDRSAWMVFLNVDPRLDCLREEKAFADLASRL